MAASGPDGDLLSLAEKGDSLARIVLMSADAHVRVRLTPLGRWAINQELRAEGAHAPTTEPAATSTELTDLTDPTDPTDLTHLSIQLRSGA